MKLVRTIIFIFLISVIIAACSSSKTAVKSSMGQSTPTGCSTPEPNEAGTCKLTNPTVPAPVSIPAIVSTIRSNPTLTQTDQEITVESRTDNQGNVVVDIKPLNLDKPGDTLIFDISMNTHSVDLSMDLVPLTTLTTDTGVTLPALKWDGPRGGHHVEGQLSFRDTSDGKNILDGVSSITITIKDVDAAARTFTWQLHS